MEDPVRAAVEPKARQDVARRDPDVAHLRPEAVREVEGVAAGRVADSVDVAQRHLAVPVAVDHVTDGLRRDVPVVEDAVRELVRAAVGDALQVDHVGADRAAQVAHDHPLRHLSGRGDKRDALVPVIPLDVVDRPVVLRSRDSDDRARSG